MPTKSSWSTNSTSICRRSRPHASPHRESSRTPQPPQCSGDLGKPALDPTHFFPRVEKVGLEPALAHRDGVAWAHRGNQRHLLARALVLAQLSQLAEKSEMDQG